MSGSHGIAIVLGTRPEVIKNWAIVEALREAQVRHCVLHTNQHADRTMHGEQFEQLGYRPDAVLDGRYSLGRAVDWVGERLRQDRFDTVLVNGDTAAALVGALAGMYSDRRIVHVEAGLRSFDPRMHEERNRIMVDAVAHLLLAYTEREAVYLRGQRECRGEVRVVGNTTIDLLHSFKDRLVTPRRGPFLFATMHRKEFTDDPERMRSVFAALATIANEVPVVLPLHPRTADAMRRAGIGSGATGAVELVTPMGPFEALAHIAAAECVLTDSGCMQEEACILGTPCVTVRDNSERGITLELGANVLSGFATEAIVRHARTQRSLGRGTWRHPYGEPGVGRRIVEALVGRPS